MMPQISMTWLFVQQFIQTKKISKLQTTGLLWEALSVVSLHKGPVMWKVFLCYYLIMWQTHSEPIRAYIFPQWPQWVNSLAPGRYGCYLKLVISNSSRINILRISSEIVLRWMPQDLTDDKSTLVQVMAWCRQATSHYLNQCWPRSMASLGHKELNSIWVINNIILQQILWCQ